MKNHKCAIVSGVVFLAGLAALIYDRSVMMLWVGAADVEVEFVITDESDGQPVNAATIVVDVLEGSPDKQIRLISNPDGAAHRQLVLCRTTGRQSALSFTNTYAVWLPYWRMQVSAPGYQVSEWIDLHSPERAVQSKQIEPGRRKLVIPVAIRKKAVE